MTKSMKEKLLHYFPNVHYHHFGDSYDKTFCRVNRVLTPSEFVKVNQRDWVEFIGKFIYQLCGDEIWILLAMLEESDLSPDDFSIEKDLEKIETLSKANRVRFVISEEDEYTVGPIAYILDKVSLDQFKLLLPELYNQRLPLATEPSLNSELMVFNPSGMLIRFPDLSFFDVYDRRYSNL